MKINKKLLMAALASAVIVSAPQVKTYADTQIDDTKAVTEKLIDNQLAKAAQNAEQKNSEKAQAENTADAEEKQKQQESSELKEEKEINSKKTGFGSQALNHPAQATELRNVDNVSDDSALTLSEEKQPEAQKTGEATTSEPNYTEDEKKVGNYRESQMEPGQVDENGDLVSGGPTHTEANNPEMDFKDGVRYKTLEPGAASPDKKKFGIEIEIDKEKGQRTYTEIGFTNSGLLGGVLDNGSNPANDEGKKLAEGFKDPNYKAEANLSVTPAGRQRNVNIEASEEDLKHINNTANDNTTMAWQGKYKVDNPNGLKATQGNSASFTFTVNPWPNENDKLQLIKLEGEYKDKVFVKGQEVDTGIKVENLDDNAKERLLGQVYNPNTGKVVPGASAYIDANGIVKIKMPKGALKQDESGKYVVDEDSIFNTADYKGIQHLDVRFFARPRTKAEFENVATKNNEFTNGNAKYVGTDAGTGTINHKGTDIEIDKQGIDRYDHYNLIGKFNLNLDDTRHYDQVFKDQKGNKLDEHSSTKVIPGEDFSVQIQDPAEPGGTQKTGADMDGAYSRGEASGKLKEEFLDIANKQIADDLGVDYKEFITSDDYADKRWTVVGKSDNISKFTIRAPKQAKAGDFLALPVEYTYTNGSTDTHWFHFVVQESNNNRPEYLAEVGPQGNTLVNNPIVPKKDEDLKKNQPKSYELIGDTFKDNKGNVWNVSIDQTTGAVTATLPAKLPGGKEINGGEKLTVPVKVKYTDQTTGEEKSEEIKAQFIATKQHKTLTNETTTSEIPFDTEVEYDENLPEGYFQEFQAGQKGELKISFVQDTLNGKKGIFKQDGTFKEGESKIVVETVKEPTKRIIKIGTKPATTKVEIPFDTEYEVDNNLEAGKTELINDGEKGEVTITTTRNEDGTVTINQKTTKEAKNKKIKIGTKTQGTIVDTDKIPFGYKVEFDPDFYKNYPDAKDNYKIVTPGKEGENTKTWTIVNSEKVGDPEVKITDPVDAVIKVGQKDYSGTVTNTVTKEIPYTVKVVENPELEAGKSNVKQKGVAGSKTFEYSGEIFNGALKEGSSITEKELTDKYVEPKEEIIEIGTKPADNEKTYEREVGVEVEYVYDNTKEKGYRNIEELVPGKVITKVVNKYNPETGEIETTEEIEVIPGKRKVTFGTKDFTGEYEEVDKNIVPYETEIVFDSNLKAGEKVVDQAGVNGETTTTTKKHIENGEVVRSEDPVTEETKKVQNQIIRVGTMTDGKHSYTEKLPYKYEIEYDSNLKAGEYVIDVEGKEGSKTTEWTIKNSEVVEDSASVTEHTPATNAKIRVGKKDFTGNVSHEVTEEIPYDVKVIEDPNMIAGTSEVVTEGKAGSKTTKYTQGIRNGEAEGKLTSEVTSTTNPTQQVIKVGTKPAENKEDYAQDVDVKVEYEYNPNLDKGVVKVGELTKGKVEIKTVNKYDPKTGEITTTEEEKVTEATQKIIVGTKDFTGTYKYEKTCPLPFEVTITEDPNLAKGEKVVDQEGQVGSKTTYYEQDIKNGQPDGDPKQLNEKINSQPKNHIVRIGTKVAESSTVKVVEREIPFKTEYIYDENLESGKEVVESEGKVGKEKVTITTKITDGTGETSEETTTITEKEDRKVRIGTKPVTKVVEKPFNTEYVYDENLEAGITEEVTPGKNGKVTITTTYDKNQKKVVTSETEEAGQNRVVKIGGKTNGTEKVKEEIPFEVEVKKDPSFKKGEWKYATDDEGNELKGEKGEQEKTLTIVNSKVTETSEPTVTKKAKKAVVLVGEGTNDGTHEIVEKKNIDYKTVIEYDENLDAGQQEVVKEGNPGEQERTNTLVIKDGQVTETKEGEFKTTKEATDRVVKIGTKPVTKVVEKPFNTEYIYDENLEAGKTEEVTPGKNGKVTITTTYDKDQKKVVTSETEEAGQNRVVKIGGKTNGTEKVKEEIPFEVEVKKDPSFKKGEWKYATDDEGNELKGEKGEQEKTLTIVNSKVTETSDPTVTKQPKKAVILVGEDVNDGTHTITEEVDVPFETKIEFDDSLKPGEQKVIQEGESGKKSRHITLTIQDGKVTNTDEGEFTQTKAPKDKIIKVGRNTEGKVEHKEEIPFGYKVEEVEDLKKGEYRIVKPGKVGTKTTTWTIENSKVVGEPTKESVPSEDALIQVGKGTNDGTHEIVEKKELPFETRYEYDDSLEPGEEKVVTPGSPGEQERTNKLVIKDGKVVEVQEGEFKTTKEPQERLIKIGRKSTEGETKKTIEREIPYETKVIYDENLEAGSQVIEKEGKLGKEEVTITQKVKDSKPVGDPTETTKTITEKEDRVVRVGVKPVVKEVELGNDTEYRHNPELKEGETKVIEEGSKGSVKYTTTFNKETGKLEVTEERVEPKNKVVEYGSKTDGEFTYESEQAFDTKIIEDSNLEAGKTVVDQEGVTGRTKTTVKIENSKKVSENTETIVEKQDKIVRVGTKNVCEIPPVKSTEGETTKTIEREIPYETKVIYDETLESGTQKIENEGKAGKEEVTITQKVKDSKPVGDPTETTKTITEKEDRIVRIGVKPVEKIVELGNDTEYRHNPDLKEGETKVIEEGSNGSVKYTTTFNKETGKLEVAEERTEPKNKVVEYGSKTEGEFIYESEKAYDIIIRENPDLEAGKTKVVQEGIVGKTETTVKIENSKEVSRDTKTITEKQDKIIEIGTKNVCEIPPVDPEDLDQPGEDPKDPETPGEDPKDPETPGEDPKDPETPGEDPKDPGTPGEKPNEPGTPGEDPKDPETPGEDPKDPEQPGGKDPKDPGTPGEKPNEPGTPGEDPKDPETPGEDPKDPEQPGGKDPKDPETPGETPEENGKTPDNQDGDTPTKPNNTPKTPETTEQVEGKEKADTPNRRSANKLPKSGSESEIMTLAMSGLLTAAGFIGLKKKRKDR